VRTKQESARRRHEPADESVADDRLTPDDESEPDEYEELSPIDAGRAAARAVAELSGKELHGVVSVEPSGDDWLVGVEVVEDRRIPSSNDMLGLYEVRLDLDGGLLSVRRSRRYPRGKSEGSEHV
jgi:hypothetical protein